MTRSYPPLGSRLVLRHQSLVRNARVGGKLTRITSAATLPPPLPRPENAREIIGQTKAGMIRVTSQMEERAAKKRSA